jgi:hypothetical protein
MPAPPATSAALRTCARPNQFFWIASLRNNSQEIRQLVYTRPVPDQKSASQATLQPPQHPTENFWNWRNFVRPADTPLNATDFPLNDKCNEAPANSKETPQDLAHEQLQELHGEIFYENATPDDQDFFRLHQQPNHFAGFVSTT